MNWAELAKAYATIEPDPTFWGEFKKAVPRSIGQTVQGLGQVADDLGWEDNPIERYGQKVIDRNPSRINSFEDIGEHPTAALGSAMGNALGFVGPQAGVGVVGKGLGLMGAVRTGNALRGAAGQAVLAGLPSYGGIREQQEEDGNDSFGDKLTAAGGALAVGAIENLGGVQRMLGIGRLESGGTKDLLKEFGKTPLRTAGKTAVRAGLEEGGEELLQNPIEQLASYQDPTTEKNLLETGFGGAMGALGGIGLGGGIGAARGMKHRSLANDLGNEGYLDGGSRTVGGPPESGSVAPDALMRGLDRREAYQPQADFDQPGPQPQPDPEAQAYMQEQQAAAAEQELQAKRQAYVQAAAGLGANPDDALSVANKLFAPAGVAPLAPEARVYTPEQQAVIDTLPEDMTPAQISDHIDKLNKAAEKNQKEVVKQQEKAAKDAEKQAKLVEQSTKAAQVKTPEQEQADLDAQKEVLTKQLEELKPFAGNKGYTVEQQAKLEAALESGNVKSLPNRIETIKRKLLEEKLIADKLEKIEKAKPKEEKKDVAKTAEATVPVLQKETQPAAPVPATPGPTASEGVKNGYSREGLHQGFVQTGKGKDPVSAKAEDGKSAEAPASVPVQKAKVKRPKLPKDTKTQQEKDAAAFAPVEVKKEVIDGQEVEVKVYAPEATAAVKRPKVPKDAAAAPAAEVPRIAFDALEPADKKMVRAFMGYNEAGEISGSAEKGMSLRDVAKHVGGISHVKVGQRLKALGYTNELKKKEQETNAPAAVEEAAALSTEAQIESDLAAEIAAGEQQAAVEKERQKSGHLVDENGEDLSDTETGMHEDDGGTGFMEQGAMGGSSDTGQGWKSLLKNKVPFTDKRWTEVRIQAAAESLSEAPETNMHVLEQLLGEVTRREANARAEAKAKKLADTPAEKLEAQAKAREANIAKANEAIGRYNEANGTNLTWEDFGEKQQKRLEMIGRKLLIDPNNDPNKQHITMDRAIDEIGVNAQQISSGMKYSEDTGAVPNHTTGEKIFSTLNKLFFSPERLNKILKVYETQSDFKRDFPKAAAELDKRNGTKWRVAGMEYEGKIIMIAENLTAEKILSVFLHEAGVHLGMEALVGKDNLNWLAGRVEAWAKRNDDSAETKAAKLAIIRAEFSSTPSEHMKEELVAYMVQLLVEAGVNPQAAGTSESHQWFRRLWTAAKAALRRLGFKNPDFSGQNLVDLAFGAAQLQLEGSWHGTAADFRNFNHDFMSSGEGAQAFGWGSYLAERAGIAYEYWKKLVDIKNYNTSAVVKPAGLTEREERAFDRIVGAFGRNTVFKWEQYVKEVAPNELSAEDLKLVKGLDKKINKWEKPENHEGSLMAVAYNVRDDEWLRFDKAYTDQSPLVQEALKPVIKAIMQHSPSFFEGKDPDKVSGKGVYNQLAVLMASINARKNFNPANKSKFTTNEMYKNPTLVEFGTTHSDYKQAASLYLNSLGIKGNKFFDKLSREPFKISMWELTGQDESISVLTAGAFAREPGAIHPDNLITVRQDGTILVSVSFADGSHSFVPLYEIEDKSGNLVFQEWQQEEIRKGFKAAEKEFADNKTYNLVVFDDKNITRIATKVGAKRDSKSTKFSISMPPAAQATETAAQTMFQEFKDNAQVAFDKATVRGVFGHDLAKLAVKAGLSKAQGFFDLTLKKDAIRNRETQEVERIMQQTADLPDRDAADKFLRDSTTDKQWGFAPSWQPGIVPDAGMEKRFLALKPDTQKVVREIFEHGHRTYEVMRTELTADIDAEYDALIAGATDEATRSKLEKDKAKATRESSKLMPTLVGPYAPLKRFGDYAVIVASPEFMKAKEDGNVNLQNVLIADNSTLHHSVEFFDTKGQANTRARELQASNPGHTVKSIIKQEMFKTDMLPWGNIAKLRNAINEGPDTKYKTAMQRIALEMYLRSVAETSARKAQIRRKGTTERAGVAGSADMFRAFAAHGQATAHYIAALQGNKAINKQISEMRTEAKAKDTNDKVVLALNEIMARYSQSLDYRPTPFVDKAMRATSIWLLATSPAYYLQNSMQTFMLTLPYLAGKYKERAAPAVFKAYGDVIKSVRNMTNEVDIQNLPISDPEKDMLKALWEGGKLDIGINAEMGRWTKDGGHSTGPMDTAMKFIDKKMVQVELLNRMTAALAAYRLSGSAAYATEVIDTTHGNYASSNAPRFFQTSGLAKLVTQFRKYQLIQLSLLIGLAHKSFKAEKPEDRSAGRLALSWLVAQQLMITGMYGTIPTALMMVAGALGGDDDKDWERNARRAIGDDSVSDFLLHGIPAGLGLDLSKKLGINNAFSILPFAETPTDKSSYEKAFTAAGGAFFGGLGSQAFTALGHMKDGEFYKGIETALPKGLRDAMKGYRYATEGITSGRNDVLLKPDEIGALAGFAQAVGLPTTTISNFQRERGDIIELSKHFTDQDHELKNDYAKAARSRDSDKMAELRAEWKEQQESKRVWTAEMQRQGFRDPKLLERMKPQPLGNLLKAPQDQAKRERPWAR